MPQSIKISNPAYKKVETLAEKMDQSKLSVASMLILRTPNDESDSDDDRTLGELTELSWELRDIDASDD